MRRVLVVGAGHGGVEFCAALRGVDSEVEITLLDAQHEHPYQRPPLSKDGLEDAASAPLPIRGEDFFRDHRIDLRRGTRAAAIHPAARQVVCADGGVLEYDHLVLATGATRVEPAFAADGVHTLHTAADAARLQLALASARRVAVIGAGFIGLEVASAARARGAHVEVIAPGERVLSRAVSPELARTVAARHRAAGVTLRLGQAVVGVSPADSGSEAASARRVTLADGSVVSADVVVAGIGVRPRTALAEGAGLAVANGIVVDEWLRTSDPAISAIGDCAAFPDASNGERHRLESVQNAASQARHLAAVLSGSPDPYRELPWFWSVQGDQRIQLAGIPKPGDARVELGDAESGPYVVLHFRDEQLTAVESIGAAPAHLAARRILAGPPASYADLSASDFDLRQFARSRSTVPHFQSTKESLK